MVFKKKIIESFYFVGLPCCEKATNEKCRKACKTSLVTMTNNEEIVAELIKSCGDALPYVSVLEKTYDYFHFVRCSVN